MNYARRSQQSLSSMSEWAAGFYFGGFMTYILLWIGHLLK